MLDVPSQGQMDSRNTVVGLDKRKACVFLILVAIGLLCLGVLAYVLFFATPHANTVIKNGGTSMIRQVAPQLLASCSSVRS